MTRSALAALVVSLGFATDEASALEGFATPNGEVAVNPEAISLLDYDAAAETIVCNMKTGANWAEDADFAQLFGTAGTVADNPEVFIFIFGIEHIILEDSAHIHEDPEDVYQALNEQWFEHHFAGQRNATARTKISGGVHFYAENTGVSTIDSDQTTQTTVRSMKYPTKGVHWLREPRIVDLENDKAAKLVASATASNSLLTENTSGRVRFHGFAISNKNAAARELYNKLASMDPGSREYCKAVQSVRKAADAAQSRYQIANMG